MDTLELDIKIQKTTQSKLPQVDFENLVFGKVYSDHMFVADYIDGQWQDSRIIPYDDLKLSPATSALHYGQSVFEGLKAYKSEDDKVLVFRPLENFHRLNASAERICMPPLPENIYMRGLTELLKIDRGWVPKHSNYSLYIRPFLFATDEFIGLKPSKTYKFIIFTSPVGAFYSEPVKVKIEQHYIRSAAGGTGFAKVAGNYAASLKPAQLAQEAGFHQLLWTDAKEHKYIEESGTMNVMFLIDGTLVTAPSMPHSDTILPGITRKSVLTLAQDWGLKVEERHLAVDELIDAIETNKLQEAFGTGTAATIAQIALIHYNGKDYHLPEVSTRKFSNKVMKNLSDIQRGKADDVHNWVTKI